MAIEDVECETIRELEDVELGLFGKDRVEVRFEEGVEGGDFGADGALSAGFEFGFLGVGKTE